MKKKEKKAKNHFTNTFYVKKAISAHGDKEFRTKFYNSIEAPTPQHRTEILRFDFILYS